MNQSDFPDFALYAILKNSTVIDCGVGDTETNVVSLHPNRQVYSKKDGFEFVPMTLDNSPAEIGMKYDGKKFYYGGEINV